MACQKCGSASHPSAFSCPNEGKSFRSTFISKSYEADKRLDRELGLYRQARKEGSQPWSTKTEDSERAMRESDRLGRAFRADNMAETMYPEHAKALREWTESERESFRGTH